MKYLIIGALLFSFIGCNSNKNTTQHDNDGHTHNASSHHHKNYFESYTLKSESYGTNTVVTVDGDTRTMITNSLPDHKTGQFPSKGNPNTISSQNVIYTFPVHSVYTGKATWVREPGVALNGVKFEPGTAEVVQCDTGENYRVEALQDVIDLGLDFNHAHVQPTGAYHYHGTPTAVIEEFDTGEDLVHIGFAHDGFPIYYSKTSAYKPSYKLVDGTREGEDCTYENPHNSIDLSVGGHHDGTYTSDFEFIEGSGDLDECNGISIDGDYMYLVTDEFPYVSRCLMGEVTKEEHQGPPNGGERLSVDDLFEHMDSDNNGKLSKAEVKGPLAQDFSKIDTNNDTFLSKEELTTLSKRENQRPGGRR